jgi:hypothetical protein
MHITADTLVIALAILAHAWTPRVYLSGIANAVVAGFLNTLAILIVVLTLAINYLK